MPPEDFDAYFLEVFFSLLNRCHYSPHGSVCMDTLTFASILALSDSISTQPWSRQVIQVTLAVEGTMFEGSG